MAEGKLMYHCSLAWRLMSWTLVGKPMGAPRFTLSSHITRYHKTRLLGTKTYWNDSVMNVQVGLSSQRPNPSGRSETCPTISGSTGERRTMSEALPASNVAGGHGWLQQ